MKQKSQLDLVFRMFVLGIPFLFSYCSYGEVTWPRFHGHACLLMVEVQLELSWCLVV